jgi:hypothetical protein
MGNADHLNLDSEFCLSAPSAIVSAVLERGTFLPQTPSHG